MTTESGRLQKNRYVLILKPLKGCLIFGDNDDNWRVTKAKMAFLVRWSKKIERFAARQLFPARKGKLDYDIMKKMGIMNELKRQNAEPTQLKLHESISVCWFGLFDGSNSQQSRIMQLLVQRTDTSLKLVVNRLIFLLKLSEDVC